MFETRWNNNHIEVLKNQIYQIKEIIGNSKDILVSLTDTNIYKYKGVCSGGKLSFNICPDGYIYPCTLAVGNKDFSIGNIYDGIDKTSRDKFLSKSYLDNNDCKGCDLSNSCDGNRCKIINKLTRGSYFYHRQ